MPVSSSAHFTKHQVFQVLQSHFLVYRLINSFPTFSAKLSHNVSPSNRLDFKLMMNGKESRKKRK